MAEMQIDRKLTHSVKILEKKWLSRSTFELVLEKPEGFSYTAGQKILCGYGGLQREYSLASAPVDKNLVLCIRLVESGIFSPELSILNTGEIVSLSKAYGFLFHRPGKSVFVATGTGIAPFLGYIRSGIQDFILLHGVKEVQELYYREEFENSASHYIPCLTSETAKKVADCMGYAGRVTSYLDVCLQSDEYDFYLCGNGKMIRDALLIIDSKFPDSRVFTEIFY